MVNNPFEVAKCKTQVYKGEGSLPYSQVIGEIVRSDGWVGLYRGFWPMIYRDVPGWAAYFYVYEAAKIRHEDWKLRTRED